MTKKERIRAAVTGEQPDRLPYSFWSHLPDVDLDPVALAEGTYAFYREFDLDFIKTMNNGMYAVEDFGCAVDFSDVARGGVATITHTPVAGPADWAGIRACAVDGGSLARELRSLILLLDKLRGEDVPVVFTVFSPLTIADKLSRGALREHIRNGHGGLVKQALNAIAETTANLAVEAVRLGADGVFFASQLSSYDILTVAEYREYGMPYDLRVLDAARDGWFNILHAHGDNIMFELLRDYPVAVFNWHVWETLPALDEAYALSGKCLMGGLNRTDITDGNRNALQNQIFECQKRMGGRNHILTPGCVIRHPLDAETLAYVRRTKDFVNSRLGA